MGKNNKQATDHHDNVIRLKVESEKIIDDFKYTRDKVEREILYLKTSRNRVVDIKISNYDKIIDLEIFLLKVFIPILSISFAAGVNIIGIDTYGLKWICVSILILVGFFIVITFIFRKKIVDSEQKNYERECDLIRKAHNSNFKNLETRIEKILTNKTLSFLED